MFQFFVWVNLRFHRLNVFRHDDKTTSLGNFVFKFKRISSHNFLLNSMTYLIFQRNTLTSLLTKAWKRVHFKISINLTLQLKIKHKCQIGADLKNSFFSIHIEPAKSALVHRHHLASSLMHWRPQLLLTPHQISVSSCGHMLLMMSQIKSIRGFSCYGMLIEPEAWPSSEPKLASPRFSSANPQIHAESPPLRTADVGKATERQPCANQ